jgi:hypothetical protein
LGSGGGSEVLGINAGKSSMERSDGGMIDVNGGTKPSRNRAKPMSALN